MGQSRTQIEAEQIPKLPDYQFPTGRWEETPAFLAKGLEKATEVHDRNRRCHTLRTESGRDRRSVYRTVGAAPCCRMERR